MTDDTLATQINQMKAMVDLFHLYGIAVLFDVVYNHAGGALDDDSLYLLRPTAPRRRQPQPLLHRPRAGPAARCSPTGTADVRQFLIDNATSSSSECHCDGFRYDEVTVIDRFGGWNFCQNLTDTVHFVKDQSIHIAEYWNPDQSWVIKPTAAGGAGFDAVWSDRLAGRGARGVGAGCRRVRTRRLVRRGSRRDLPSAGFRRGLAVGHCIWRITTSSSTATAPESPGSADGSNSRSWYARSRSRVATGLLMTSPGIPMLFMGEEFLEDKSWSDSNMDLLLFWDGLKTDKVMQDYLRFCRELIGLRKHQPALRSEAVNVFHVHNENRVIAFQRWVVGSGRDVVVAATLSETTYWGYALGFPGPGSWREVFNSDVYDNWVNPITAGNGGSVTADGPPLHGLPARLASSSRPTGSSCSPGTGVTKRRPRTIATEGRCTVGSNPPFEDRSVPSASATERGTVQVRY